MRVFFIFNYRLFLNNINQISNDLCGLCDVHVLCDGYDLDDGHGLCDGYDLGDLGDGHGGLCDDRDLNDDAAVDNVVVLDHEVLVEKSLTEAVFEVDL